MASDSTFDPKYQTELPPLVQRSDYISDPTNPRAQSGCPSLSTMGLPLPLGPTHDGPGIVSDELLPGLPTTDPWSDENKCNFILGLHVHGRNFTAIKHFVETKKMVDILSYYYGEFCSSTEYIQWSESRKEKRKMRKTYVELNEVFSGTRHRELISRLVSGASGNIPTLQAFKPFPYRETTVLDYVLYLKGVVGIKNLVEAIAFGKGEKDLTRKAFERLSTGKPRDGGIGCSTGPRLDIGSSCHSLARDESPPAGPSNGSPRRDPVGDAHSVEPSHGAHLFDLNSLPQASEESEQENEPIMADNDNGTRNDDLVVVDMNPLRHSTRIRPQTVKGKSYGDSIAKNRKRKR